MIESVPFDMDGVLLGMDGVLLDSESHIREAAIKMLLEKGHFVQEGDFLLSLVP